MSKMKDMWDGTIEVKAEDGYVYVASTEWGLRDEATITYMKLDADLTRKLIKKLKKALAEVEGN